MTGRAFHRAEDGTETDITEGVQALYDLAVFSLERGSGCWSYEDALPVAVIGRLFGFEQIEEVERYANDLKHAEESAAWLREHPRAMPVSRHPHGYLLTGAAITGLLGGPQYPPPHDHVLSSAGRCMWPRCRYEAEA